MESGLNIFDYTVIGILFLSVLFGFLRGFIKQIFTVFNIALAFVITYNVFPYAIEHYGKGLKESEMARLGFVGGLYLVSWAIVAFINMFVVASMGSAVRSVVDRLVGFLFGLAKGVGIVLAIYIGLVQIDPQPKWFAEAKTKPALKMVSEALVGNVDMSGATKKLEKTALVKDLKTLFSGSSNIPAEVQQRFLDLGFTTSDVVTINKILESPSNDSQKITLEALSKASGEMMANYLYIIVDSYRKALGEGRIPEASMVNADDLSHLQKSIDDLKNKK